MEKFKIKNKSVEMNKYLKDNVEKIKEMINKNFDGVILIDGMEGSGKSELGKQLCLYIDNKFDDKGVIYSPEQFNEWLETAKKGQACLFDEFVLMGLSTEALSAIQNTIIKQFTTIRKKNLFIVLVIPYIFMLRKYFAVARTRALIHVYTSGMERGHFKFYNYTEKQYIYNYGYKTWLYSPHIKPSFAGRFGAWSDKFLDDDKIEAKKDDAIKSIEEDKLNISIKSKHYQVVKACLSNIWDARSHPTEYKYIQRLLKKLDIGQNE